MAQRKGWRWANVAMLAGYVLAQNCIDSIGKAMELYNLPQSQYGTTRPYWVNLTQVAECNSIHFVPCDHVFSCLGIEDGDVGPL